MSELSQHDHEKNHDLLTMWGHLKICNFHSIQWFVQSILCAWIVQKNAMEILGLEILQV